jgi:transposase-like protein
MGKRRTFTPEFKLQVVLELLSGRTTNAQLCREYQLAPAVKSDWKEHFLQHAPELFATPRSRSADYGSLLLAASFAARDGWSIANVSRACRATWG